MRLLERRVIDDRLGIEDDQVGSQPHFDPAAVLQTQSIGWPARHLLYGRLQRHEGLLPDVAAQDAGVGAVEPGVHLLVCVDSRRRYGVAVGADHPQWMSQEVAGVSLHPTVDDSRHGASLLLFELQNSLRRFDSASLGYLRDGTPHHALVRLRLDVRNYPRVEPGSHVSETRGDLLPDTPPRTWVTQASHVLVGASRLGPRRDELLYSGPGSVVRMTVVGDVQAFAPGLLEDLQHLRTVAVPARGLPPAPQVRLREYGQMRVLDRHPRPLADVDRLFDGRDVLAGAKAGVRGVEDAVIVR